MGIPVHFREKIVTFALVSQKLMIMRKVFFFFTAAVLTLAACTKTYEISVDPATVDAPATGGVYEISLNCNAAWTSKIDGNVNVIVEPDFGAGSATVTLTILDNLQEGDLSGIVTFTCGPDPSKIATVTISQPKLTTVSWGGVEYPVKKLADGNIWFVENLRYVPEGKSVTADLTALDNGVWYPVDAKNKTLTDNADTVAKKGYLYSAEAALGLAPGTVNDANCLSYEGAQGICPPGWHLPTIDEIANLVGRVTASKYDLKQDPGPVVTAPYWSQELASSTIPLANADGFNVSYTLGCITAAATATKGTVQNTLSYILSSTAYFRFTEQKPEGFFNNQFYAIYPSVAPATKEFGGSCNGATFNYRGGAAVRCVKTKLLK